MSGEVIATSTKEALFNTLKNNADLKKKLAELEAENKRFTEWKENDNKHIYRQRAKIDELESENKELREAILTWWNAEEDEDGYEAADNKLGQVAKELATLTQENKDD